MSLSKAHHLQDVFRSMYEVVECRKAVNPDDPLGPLRGELDWLENLAYLLGARGSSLGSLKSELSFDGELSRQISL